MQIIPNCYDPEIDELTLLNGTDQEHNFTLHNATCHADCTNSEGRCNKDCEGYTYQGDSCHFNSTTILQDTCNDHIDNDCDKLIDCDDPDCYNDLSCSGNATLHGYVFDDQNWPIDLATITGYPPFKPLNQPLKNL